MAEYEVSSIQRGQVYWIKDFEDDDDGENVTWKKKRPAVILSTNIFCETASQILMVAFLTTQYKEPNVFEPQVYSTGKKSWVRCDQITTIRREWIQEYVCTLNDYEMEMVEAGIHASLSLCPARGSSEREIAELKQEKMSLEAELSMWKRLYEKTMEHLIEQKFANDVLSGVRKKNTDRVPRMIPDEPISEEPEEPQVVDAPPTKVNINKASAVEINAATGLSMNICYAITGHRKTWGEFTCLEDLLMVSRVKEYHLKKYGDRFCYE